MTSKPTNYITRRGYAVLRDELTEPRTAERPLVVQEVADAAAQGDRSENAEYIYGKRRLREIDRRMRFLQKRLEHAVVVDPGQQTGDRVFFGAKVVVDEDDKETQLQIVGADEIAPERGLISYHSPIGAALMGKSVDDEVVVKTPDRIRVLTILEVRYVSSD